MLYCKVCTNLARENESNWVAPQEEGLQAFLVYLRDLISRRAEEDYTSLVEGGGIHPFPT